MDAIARAAGVNKALFYYYFPNKQELYRRLVLEHLEAMAASLSLATNPAEPPERALRACLEAFAGTLEGRPFAAQFIVREMLNAWGHLNDEDIPTLFRTTRPIVTTVERGIASGTFRSVPPLLVHFLAVAGLTFFSISQEARARGARVVGEPGLAADPRAFVSFLSDTLLAGLARRAESPRPPGGSP